MADYFRDLRDDGVAEGFGPLTSVHPSGRPISHSNRWQCGRQPYRIAVSVMRSLYRFFVDLEKPQPLFPIDRVGVGNDPDSIPLMLGTNGARRYAMPLRVMPDLGQVSENSVHPVIKQRCHVLHDRDFGSYQANGSKKMFPEARTGAGKSGTSARSGNVLTGEAAADGVCLARVELSRADVVMDWDMGPVLLEDATGERLDLAHGDRDEPASALKAQAEGTQAAEKVEDAQFCHVTLTIDMTPKTTAA